MAIPAWKRRRPVQLPAYHPGTDDSLNQEQLQFTRHFHFPWIKCSTRPRPNRWSLFFLHMVFFRQCEKNTPQRYPQGPANKIRATTDTISENNENLLSVAWWVNFN